MDKEGLKSPENKAQGMSQARTAAGTTAARNQDTVDS